MQKTYLIHHGIKGQKWGIRRYQNEDGTLTPEGEKQYNQDESINDLPSDEVQKKGLTGGQKALIAIGSLLAVGLTVAGVTAAGKAASDKILAIRMSNGAKKAKQKRLVQEKKKRIKDHKIAIQKAEILKKKLQYSKEHPRQEPRKPMTRQEGKDWERYKQQRRMWDAYD